MADARSSHTATMLPDGRVLIAGGVQVRESIASVEVYDPESGAWTAVQPMLAERGEHTATFLPDGGLLIAGGRDGTVAHDTTETLDVSSLTWSASARMRHKRAAHTATTLSDGRIIVIGGGGAVPLNTAEIYDPELSEWSGTDALLAPRRYHTATLVAGGNVIVAGGKAGVISSLTRTEMFVPGSGAWAAGGSIRHPRWGHAATLLEDGSPLLLGGYDGWGRGLADAEKIDRLGAALAERFGRLDILVANAGMLGQLSPVGHYAPDDWEATLALNLGANWRLIRSLDPLLRASPSGRAIFVTAAAAQVTPAFWGPYATSKAGLEALARCYAAEVRRSPLRVNLLDPGPVATELRRRAYPGEDASRLPVPDAVTEPFVALAEAACTEHGARIGPP